MHCLSVLTTFDKDALTDIKRFQSTFKDLSHTNLEGVAKIFEDKKNISPEPYSSGDGGQTSADIKQDPEMG